MFVTSALSAVSALVLKFKSWRAKCPPTAARDSSASRRLLPTLITSIDFARSNNGIESASARAAVRLPSQQTRMQPSLMPSFWMLGTTTTGRGGRHFGLGLRNDCKVERPSNTAKRPWDSFNAGLDHLRLGGKMSLRRCLFESFDGPVCRPDALFVQGLD
jgi:hypothetical protein